MQAIRKIVLLFVVAFYSSQLFAQPAIGIRGGINYGAVAEPAVIGGVLPDFKNIFGWNIGVIGEIPINRSLSFQPELALNQKGFQLREGLNIDLFKIPIPIGASAVTRVNYIDLPLLLKYKLGNQAWNAYLTAGPVFSYATGGQLQTKAQVLFDIPITSTDLDLGALGYSRMEVSASLGAGLSFDTGAGSLFFDARYVRGLTDVYDVPVVDLKLKNQGF
ncbi:MAG: porin family protein, partial [Bacteroidota bacterium]